MVLTEWKISLPICLTSFSIGWIFEDLPIFETQIQIPIQFNSYYLESLFGGSRSDSRMCWGKYYCDSEMRYSWMQCSFGNLKNFRKQSEVPDNLRENSIKLWKTIMENSVVKIVKLEKTPISFSSFSAELPTIFQNHSEFFEMIFQVFQIFPLFFKGFRIFPRLLEFFIQFFINLLNFQEHLWIRITNTPNSNNLLRLAPNRGFQQEKKSYFSYLQTFWIILIILYLLCNTGMRILLRRW